MTTHTQMWIATAVSAIACGVLVVAEKQTASSPRGDWAVRRIASKATASLSFIAVATVAVLADRGPTPGSRDCYQALIVLGLVLGAIGDVALLGSSKRAFLGGLVAFLLGHIAYVAGCAVLVSPRTWFEVSGVLSTVPPIIGLVVLAWLWRHLGDMRVAVIAYVTVIVTMMIGGLAVLQTETVATPQRQLFSLGATLFFASDLAVARDKFVARSFVNRAWGLPCYYAGQLLIAWSVRS
jgi:uncharacterized membrane protein YhhN